MEVFYYDFSPTLAVDVHIDVIFHNKRSFQFAQLARNLSAADISRPRSCVVERMEA